MQQQQGGPQVYVINENAKRERGDTARSGNIAAARTVADVIRTTLGPRSMLKMILDPVGGIVMTNDGNAILREIDVAHPAAKSMIELARAQDETCGDGSTAVIVLTGEVIAAAEPLLKRKIHPIILTQGYAQALEDILELSKNIAFNVDTSNKETVLRIIDNCLSTKFSERWSKLLCNMAFEAVSIVARQLKIGATDIDIKKYARVEKIPGGSVEDCQIVQGIIMNKDIIHPEMPKYIKNPRIVILDCPLEYKKVNSMLNVELQNGQDLQDLLKVEEDFTRNCFDKIMQFKPDIVLTEKGVSDHAAQLFAKANVACFRRCKKADQIRLGAACGARIVNRLDDLHAEDVGTHAGVYELRKYGDEFFSFIHECDETSGACTILLRGASKDSLLEVERNLQDALNVCRNLLLEPKCVVGGGAFEMELSYQLELKSQKFVGVEQIIYRAIAAALEVIPRTLLQNCGGNVIRNITELRAKHAQGLHQTGVNGETGTLVDCKDVYPIWDLYTTKLSCVKTALEQACMVLRIDDLFNAKVDRQ
ncbi:TCP-1_chaperonin subunit gamma [Hexamita inflata]|uniref:T-complex protein 1 subunit gamma n=1 Tax=Hexamita inflata TaxID=28002 RepID=A0AA86NRY9_9EUKA|nr:TCP-1 chaperonin subunit gamma [Hexamita inflata]